jgi:hypothetical protein
MSNFKYFTNVELDGQTYQVPVFEIGSGDRSFSAGASDKFEYALNFSDPTLSITHDGKSIEPHGELGKALVSASLQIAWMDGLANAANISVVSTDARFDLWRTYIDNFANALNLEVQDRRDDDLFELGWTFATSVSSKSASLMAIPTIIASTVRNVTEAKENTLALTFLEAALVMSRTGQHYADWLTDQLQTRLGASQSTSIDQLFDGATLSIDEIKTFSNTMRDLGATEFAIVNLLGGMATAMQLSPDILDLSLDQDGIKALLDPNPSLTLFGDFFNAGGKVIDVTSFLIEWDIVPDGRGVKFIRAADPERLDLLDQFDLAGAATTAISVLTEIYTIVETGQRISKLKILELEQGLSELLGQYFQLADYGPFVFYDADSSDTQSALQRGLDKIADMTTPDPVADDVGDCLREAVVLRDADGDDEITFQGQIGTGTDQDYLRLTLDAYSVYTIILGPQDGGTTRPDLSIIDAQTGRALPHEMTALGLSWRVVIGTQEAEDIALVVSSDDPMEFDLRITREDGASPDRFDPSGDDFANWIDADAPALGRVSFDEDAAQITGTLEHRRDVDLFEINAQRGYAYTIKMRDSDANEVTFDLLDARGRVVADATGWRRDEIESYVAESSGKLYLRVNNSDRGHDGDARDYRIEITREASAILDDRDGDSFASATRLTLGSAYTGEIDVDDDTDMFRVDLGSSSREKAFGFTLTALDSGDPVRFRLYDSDGNRIREDDSTWFDMPFGDGLQGVYIKGDPGHVFVEVTGKDGGSDYRLLVQERTGDDIAGDASTDAHLTYVTREGSGSVNGNALMEQSGDSDWFSVDLDANSRGLYSYYLEDQGTNVGLRFVTADGESYKLTGLTEDGQSFTAIESGTHFIEATYERQTGAYVPEVIRYNDDHANHFGAATQMSFDDTGRAVATGAGEIDQDADVFAIKVRAGQGILIELQELDRNNDDDLDFEVFTANHTRLDDAAGRGDLQTLSGGMLVSPIDQTLYIVVSDGPRSLTDGAINYRLTVTDVATTDLRDDTIADARRLPRTTPQNNDTITGVLNDTDDVDFIRLYLEANTVYDFSSDDGRSDFDKNPLLSLFDVNGVQLWGEADDARSRAGLDDDISGYRTGTSGQEVLLRVESWPYADLVSDVGDYEVDIDATPLSTVLTPGQSWNEHLRGTGEKAYGFEIAEGYAVIVSIDSFTTPSSGQAFDGDDIHGGRLFWELSSKDWDDAGELSPAEVILYNRWNGSAGTQGVLSLHWSEKEAGSHRLHSSTLIEIDTIGQIKYGTTHGIGYREDTSRAMTAGETITSFLYGSYGDRVDEFRITLSQGTNYTINLTGTQVSQTTDRASYTVLENGELRTDFDALDLSAVTVVVRDANLREVARFPGNALETFTPPSDGTYYVALHGDTGLDGGYSITVQDTAALPGASSGSSAAPGVPDDRSHGLDLPPEALDLEPGRDTQVISGQFETIGDVDTVALSLSAGHSYAWDFDLEGTQVMAVTDSSGVAIAGLPHLATLQNGVLTVHEDSVILLHVLGTHTGAWNLTLHAIEQNAAPDAGTSQRIVGTEDGGSIGLNLMVPSDPEGDLTQIWISYTPSHGTMFDGDGNVIGSGTLFEISDGMLLRDGVAPVTLTAFMQGLSFEPHLDFNGQSDVSIAVQDRFGAADQVTHHIHVTAQNDAPAFPDTPELFILSGGSARLGAPAPWDADGDLLYIRIDALPDGFADVTVGDSASPQLHGLSVGDRLSPEQFEALTLHARDPNAPGLGGFRATAVDAAGVETELRLSIVAQPEDGTVRVKTFDDGRVRVTTLIDGERVSLTTADLGDRYGWDSFDYRFDAEGHVTSQRFALDNGTITQTLFEDGMRSHKILTKANGDIRTITYDAEGRRDSLTYEDIQDSRGWSSYTYRYDDESNLVNQRFVYDNGAMYEASFEDGQRSQIIRTMSNGDTRTINYGEDRARDSFIFVDVSDSRDLAQFTILYDDMNVITQKTTVYDDGRTFVTRFEGGRAVSTTELLVPELELAPVVQPDPWV